MTKMKWALLCSALATACLGAFLCLTQNRPSAALSYPVGIPSLTVGERALAMTLPALPPLPEGWGVAAEPEENTQISVPPSRPVFAPADYSVSVPKAPADAESIVTKTYATGRINNNSSVTVDEGALLAHVPDLNLTEEGPQILILHTHTTEAYNETGQDWYSGEDVRSADPSRNLVHMGNLLEEELTSRGYGVIHAQKIHDEDFNRSYTESNATVREYLEKFPSIGVVIDLHRDSLIDASGTKYRPTVEINGKATAQIMLLMGVGNDTYPHPNRMENLSLALRIQRQGELFYPGLMRPILIRPSRYNQYLSNGAILVELGACGNTPEEAERAAVIFGEICAKALDEIREAQG